MKVYTKTGDDGTTSLYDGTRVSKESPIFDVLGSIDELAAHIGVLSSFTHTEVDFLAWVQKRLLDIGSIIATPLGNKTNLPTIESGDVSKIEDQIDFMDLKLAPLTEFLVMVDETPMSAQAHVCRTVCRRVEREMEKYGNIGREVTRFINRLSDFFFTVARVEKEVYKTEECSRTEVLSFYLKMADQVKDVIGIIGMWSTTVILFHMFSSHLSK